MILVNVFQVSNKIIKVLTLLSKASWLIRGDLHIKIAGVVIRKIPKKIPKSCSEEPFFVDMSLSHFYLRSKKNQLSNKKFP